MEPLAHLWVLAALEDPLGQLLEVPMALADLTDPQQLQEPPLGPAVQADPAVPQPFLEPLPALVEQMDPQQAQEPPSDQAVQVDLAVPQPFPEPLMDLVVQEGLLLPLVLHLGQVDQEDQAVHHSVSFLSVQFGTFRVQRPLEMPRLAVAQAIQRQALLV